MSESKIHKWNRKFNMIFQKFSLFNIFLVCSDFELKRNVKREWEQVKRNVKQHTKIFCFHFVNTLVQLQFLNSASYLYSIHRFGCSIFVLHWNCSKPTPINFKKWVFSLFLIYLPPPLLCIFIFHFNGVKYIEHWHWTFFVCPFLPTIFTIYFQ